MEFAKMIKDARKKMGWTVYELAQQLGLKSPGYISRIEGKGEIPGPDMVIKLSEVLGLDPEAMINLATREKVNETSQQVHQKFENAFMLYRKGKQG